MRTTTTLLVTTAMLTFARGVVASDDYRCTIERVVTPTHDSDSVQKMLTAQYVSKSFTVERRTGLMAGALKNSFEKPPLVVDQGSKANSYKVIATLKVGEPGVVGSSVKVLVVNEFSAGAKKPFLYLDLDVVYSGTCEHY